MNTLYYIGFHVPLLIILAFSLAMLLNAKIRGRGAYRTVFYLPSLVPVVASSMIWIFMLRTRGGLINQVLGLAGIKAIPWLQRPEWAKPALILMSLWGFGGQMVIYLAGLQGISQELYEAADIDGASGGQKIFRSSRTTSTLSSSAPTPARNGNSDSTNRHYSPRQGPR